MARARGRPQEPPCPRGHPVPAGLLRLPEVPPRVGDPRGHHPAGRGAAVATGWHCGAVPERGGDGWLCPAATSPTLHPVQSPQNRFCILTVAPDTLPAIATMLIDVLFYSHRWVARVGTSSAVVPQLGVTPLRLPPCGFPSSGCVLQSVVAPWGTPPVGTACPAATPGNWSPRVPVSPCWGTSHVLQQSKGGRVRGG